MKLLYTLLFCLIALSQSMALNIQFVSSPVHGTLNLFYTLSQGRSSNPSLVELFEKSKYNTPSFRQKIEAWRKIEFEESFEREGFPKSRPSMLFTGHAIHALSISCKTIPEFDFAISALVPISERIKLIAALNELAPIYNNLVIEPTLVSGPRYLELINKQAKTQRGGYYLSRMAHFYGATADTGGNVMVGVITLPGRAGFSTATPMQSVVSMITSAADSNGIKGMLVVVMHELCHVQYQNQAAARQNEFENWFTSNQSPDRIETYKLMDEGLATVLANGWYFREFVGRLDTNEWYHEPYINKIAHAMLPIVDKYMLANKALDKAFVDEVIKTTGQTLGPELQQLGNVLRQTAVISADSSDAMQNLKSGFDKLAHIGWFSLMYPITSENVTKFNNSGMSTRIIFLTSQTQNWTKIASQYQLEKIPADIAKHKNPLLVTHTKSGIPVILALLPTKNGIDRFFKAITKIKSIPKNPQISAL